MESTDRGLPASFPHRCEFDEQDRWKNNLQAALPRRRRKSRLPFSAEEVTYGNTTVCPYGFDQVMAAVSAAPMRRKHMGGVCRPGIPVEKAAE